MTTKVLTLTEFLLARIAEDEAAAKTATPGQWEGGYDDSANPYWIVITALTGDQVAMHDVGEPSQYEEPHGREGSDAVHIARHDPARVLTRCAADRLIVERCEPGDWSHPHWRSLGEPGEDERGDILAMLALPYADHSDYRPEWKP